MFAATSGYSLIKTLKQQQKQINKFRADRDYYNNDNKVSLTNEEELMKVADSKSLKEFIKKRDAEKLLNYKNM